MPNSPGHLGRIEGEKLGAGVLGERHLHRADQPLPLARPRLRGSCRRRQADTWICANLNAPERMRIG